MELVQNVIVNGFIVPFSFKILDKLKIQDSGSDSAFEFGFKQRQLKFLIKFLILKILKINRTQLSFEHGNDRASLVNNSWNKVRIFIDRRGIRTWICSGMSFGSQCVIISRNQMDINKFFSLSNSKLIIQNLIILRYTGVICKLDASFIRLDRRLTEVAFIYLR